MVRIPDKLSDVDERVKIPAVLLILLAVGFMADGFGDSPDKLPEEAYGGGTEADLDRGAQYHDLSGSSDEQSASSGDKVVTTYRMTLEVSNVDSAMEDIESGVRTRGGFVESSSRSQDRENSGSLTVSVPGNISGAYESDLENRYDVKSKDVDRRDVTDNYNELEAEIESLETEYERLNDLINRTDDVETLVRLQERMSTVRSRLDYKQQHLERLDEDVEYSTFHLNLQGPQSFESRFKLQQTLSDAYTAVFDSLRLMIVGAAYSLPLVLLYAVYLGRRRVKDRGI